MTVRGTWVAQLVKHLISAQVLISWFMSLSPASDSAVSFRSWLPLSLSLCPLSLSKIDILGAPGWLSRLNVWLQLRSCSPDSWVRVPSQALCWQLRVWSLLQTLSVCLSVCLSLSLFAPPPLWCMLSLSLSKVNIKKKKKKCNQAHEF